MAPEMSFDRMAILGQHQSRGLLSSSPLAQPGGLKVDLSLLGRSNPTIHSDGDASGSFRRAPGTYWGGKLSGSTAPGISTAISLQKKVDLKRDELDSNDTSSKGTIQHADPQGLDRPAPSGIGATKPPPVRSGVIGSSTTTGTPSVALQDLSPGLRSLPDVDVLGNAARSTSDNGQDPWSGFEARSNAWDDVAEIESYVQALTGRRKAKIQVLNNSIREPAQKQEQPQPRKRNIPRPRDKFTDSEIPRRRLADITATPGPVHQPPLQSEERARADNLPSADGVPEQADHSSDDDTSTNPFSSNGLSASPRPETSTPITVSPSGSSPDAPQPLSDPPVGHHSPHRPLFVERDKNSSVDPRPRFSEYLRRRRRTPGDTRPTGSIISLPESDTEVEWDEDVTRESRAKARPDRKLENLEKLRKAIRMIEARKAGSPERKVLSRVPPSLRNLRPDGTARATPGMDLDHIAIEQGGRQGPTMRLRCHGLFIAHTISEDRTGNNEVVCSKMFAWQRTGTDSPNRLGPEKGLVFHEDFNRPAADDTDRRIDSNDVARHASRLDSIESSGSSSDGSGEDLPIVAPPVKKTGELVRPALRRVTRRRQRDEPGTPTYSKAVHFDSYLEHVRQFLQVDRPLAVSNRASPGNSDNEDEESYLRAVNESSLPRKTTDDRPRTAAFPTSFDEFAETSPGSPNNSPPRINLRSPGSKATESAFGKRYDFSAALRAALRHAKSALGEASPVRSTDRTRLPLRHLDTPWEPSWKDLHDRDRTSNPLPVVAAPSGQNNRVSDAPAKNDSDSTITTTRLRPSLPRSRRVPDADAASPSQATIRLEPRFTDATSAPVTGETKPLALISLSYQELVEKYCFFNTPGRQPGPDQAAPVTGNQFTNDASPELPAEIGAYGGTQPRR